MLKSVQLTHNREVVQGTIIIRDGKTLPFSRVSVFKAREGKGIPTELKTGDITVVFSSTGKVSLLVHRIGCADPVADASEFAGEVKGTVRADDVAALREVITSSVPPNVRRLARCMHQEAVRENRKKTVRREGRGLFQLGERAALVAA